MSKNRAQSIVNRIRNSMVLPANDLLRDPVYSRLWISILISSFGAQITLLALPLTAAVLLHASPSQMGLLAFFELVPYVLLSLPAGVWLDRVRKLPVYIWGEIAISIAVASVPIAWWCNTLNMLWLYVVGFMIGAVNTTAGTAAQIVLTQIVPRERLIEAHAKNALASSGAEVAGPATAGALIKLLGAPLALFADAFLLLTSATILRKIQINEMRVINDEAHFLNDLKTGLKFVANNKILVNLALIVGGWQVAYNAALVVQILFATRTLGLSEHAVGLSYVCMGLGTILASAVGNRISQKLGPGLCMIVGIFVCGFGWGVLALAPANGWGIAAFALMLTFLAIGGVFIFINFLALRQSVTPEPLLGRMTSTMRWLILIPAGPGALLGGWLGENFGLRHALAFSAIFVLILGVLAWHNKVIRAIKQLPATPH
ncbi:MFS transporter [Undibacterium sp. LX40W]|uniref:MFS transporter n=1 Tax=Undibacterium nitidum TaxID=2762298 RepID=A0A923HL44_9BURK|nr:MULTISPECIES: MFS transporter [Undibacterium]MBC3879786.1 MFS transporter [Undibacterium nitidum]MBC3891478.1 MFS transporter [Undibacterium sp. LX40W]